MLKLNRQPSLGLPSVPIHSNQIISPPTFDNQLKKLTDKKFELDLIIDDIKEDINKSLSKDQEKKLKNLLEHAKNKHNQTKKQIKKLNKLIKTIKDKEANEASELLKEYKSNSSKSSGHQSIGGKKYFKKQKSRKLKNKKSRK